ncbi:MAG: histidinol-phosphatase [Firmicutes bacterium]|nr:histidinol-phosphatase [Bacillota bacterium]
MLVDYHLHTVYSRHAEGTILEYIKRAEALGIKEVCFTEHTSRQYLTEEFRAKLPYKWMKDEELPKYLDDLDRVRQHTSLTIKRGLEVDFFAGFEKPLQAFLEKWPLDFVLGTIHFIPKYDMAHVGLVSDEPIKLLCNYFTLVRQAVETGLFDSMAHIHLPWQTVPWPEGNEGKQALEALGDVVKAAKANNMCLEINTRAFNFEDYGTIEVYRKFLGLMRDYGVPITMGSDSHLPSEVGRNYPTVIEELARFGINEVAVFDQRERELIPLQQKVRR